MHPQGSADRVGGQPSIGSLVTNVRHPPLSCSGERQPSFVPLQRCVGLRAWSFSCLSWSASPPPHHHHTTTTLQHSRLIRYSPSPPTYLPGLLPPNPRDTSAIPPLPQPSRPPNSATKPEINNRTGVAFNPTRPPRCLWQDRNMVSALGSQTQGTKANARASRPGHQVGDHLATQHSTAQHSTAQHGTARHGS